MDTRYDHKSLEAKARDIWEKERVYSFTPSKTKKLYSIDTPPPTVSGSLHIGHIFSYTHTDIIARYKRLRGFNVFYPMGFDDNGLPTERFVEKRHGIKAHMMKRSDFIKLCLKESEDVEKLFEELWRSMGLSVDWSLTYSTISDKARKVSQYSFIELFRKNLVYRKEEPSLYCTTCHTSVAQAELDSHEVATTFNEIAFKSEDGEILTIATTRPELLPACVALFFNPSDERYKHLEGSFAISPIFNKKVPILADDKVDKEKGTGLVMCCTFGDQTDIYWFKKHKLPFIGIIGFDGKLKENAHELAGLKVIEARSKILELLDQAGFLISKKPITHSVSVHERCKQEIEYLILSQWFVKILDHKEKLIELADEINWYPSFMKVRYKDWVGNLGWDWCISRQRFFGIPFPLWHCNNCSNILLASEQDLPIDPQEQPYHAGKCEKCGSSDIKPETDVMDTWNTSSLTPQININWPSRQQEDYPTLPFSMRPQAHDIIRTWAFYTIVKAYYHQNEIPWNDIVISGHVLAGSEKISKSKENSKMSPQSLLETYPADAIRYWSASGKLGTDTAFSDNQLKIGIRLITKLWNAFRFMSEHLTNYQKASELPKHDILSEWILHKFSQTVLKYVEEFDQYNYHSALEAVEKFFWSDFCDNYLELIKDQFFNPEKYSEETLDSTRFTLYEIGLGMLQLFAPVMPHITEILYQTLFFDNEQISTLNKTILDVKRYSYNFQKSATLIEKLLEIVSEVRRLKSENALSLKTELASLTICSEHNLLLKDMEKLSLLLSGIAKAMVIAFEHTKIESSILEKIDDALHVRVKI